MRHDHNAWRSERQGFGSTEDKKAHGIDAIEDRGDSITIIGYGPTSAVAADEVHREAVARGLPTDNIPEGDPMTGRREFLAVTWIK